MATFVDYTWKVEEDRRKREKALEKTRQEHVDNLIATEEQHREQENPRLDPRKSSTF